MSRPILEIESISYLSEAHVQGRTFVKGQVKFSGAQVQEIDEEFRDALVVIFRFWCSFNSIWNYSGYTRLRLISVSWRGSEPVRQA